MKNRKGILLMIIGLICLIAITVGVTYAFFSYVKEGTTENTVTTGTIEFLYTEVDKVGAGISIEDAFPMSDAQGKVQTGSGNEFNFKVTSKLTGNFDIPYTVTARKKTVENVLDDSAVRIYLTDTTGSTERELLLDNYSNLDDYNEAPSGITEKVIYTGLVPTGSTNYEKDFTLKMWIDEKVDFSPVKDEEGNDIYPYNGKTFTITVNVYAEAKVVTDSEIDMANTTNIDNITVNDPSIQVEEVDNEEYDYLANVENEVDSVSLDIETTNPEAEVEVTRIEEETAYTTKSKIQRLSTKVTFELEEGDNLFNIKVLSANKQVEDEYVLNIYRALSCAYEAGHTWEFSYKGYEEEFIVPCSGTYKLDAYGAQGGNKYATWGLGGNATGNIELAINTQLFINIGGKGTYGTDGYDGGYNGGGSVGKHTLAGAFNWGTGSGGGATHVATSSGLLKELENNKESILIVAGGGGGTGGWVWNGTGDCAGGAGGGINGGNSNSSSYSSKLVCSSQPGGTQETGFAFGQGQSFGNATGYCGPGGSGGGYYGGYSYGVNGGGEGGKYSCSGSGGSSYIAPLMDSSTTAGVQTGDGKVIITFVSLEQ